jgi:hypothetical protein
MADEEQAVPPSAEGYELHTPEGHEIDAAVVGRWKEAFHAAGLSQAHGQRLLDWHFRMLHDVEVHEQERTLLSHHELEALRTRQRELTAKRHAPGGLSPEDLSELLRTNERLVAERERR